MHHLPSLLVVVVFVVFVVVVVVVVVFWGGGTPVYPTSCQLFSYLMVTD